MKVFQVLLTNDNPLFEQQERKLLIGTSYDFQPTNAFLTIKDQYDMQDGSDMYGRYKAGVQIRTTAGMAMFKLTYTEYIRRITEINI